MATVVNMMDMCQLMHSYPLPGGLFDQDSLFIHLFEYVIQLRQTREEMDQRQQQVNSNVAGARRR